MPEKKRKHDPSYLLLGTSFASTLVGLEIAGYCIGSWLDARVHTAFFFKLFLMIAGLAISMGDLFFLSSRMDRR